MTGISPAHETARTRYNVLPLAAVGDFGALHSQPSTNVDGSTALDLTTSAPIAANGC
ncbi:MAG: hypothetical protein ABIK31_06635 [candidate division WOR-3 bacterium]